jgi:hypothetical protein
MRVVSKQKYNAQTYCTTHYNTIIKTINLLIETLQYHLHSIHENQKQGDSLFSITLRKQRERAHTHGYINSISEESEEHSS